MEELMELKQGIFHNISFLNYLKIPAYNSSYLKELIPVPAKAKEPIEDSPEKKLGRGSHSYTLEQKSFWNNFIVAGNLAANTKEGIANLSDLLIFHVGLTEDTKLTGKKYKEYVLETVQEKTGKEVISHLDYGIIKQMDKAVKQHPTAGQLLSKGRAETTIVWQDPTTGLFCKGRIDFLPVMDDGSLHMVDLKSTKNADKYLFRKDVEYLKYFWSSAFYAYGWYIITKKFCERFHYIAVEKKSPYRTEAIYLSDSHLVKGLDMMQKALMVEVECKKHNFWPNWSNWYFKENGECTAGSDELPMSQYLEGDED